SRWDPWGRQLPWAEGGSYQAALGTLPLEGGRLGQSDVFEQTGGELADHGVERGGAIVKGRRQREDGGAGFVGGEQIAQMDAVQRRLAHRQQQPAALLEADVGGALDQGIGHAVGDGG